MKIGLKLKTKNSTREFGISDRTYGLTTLTALVFVAFVFTTLANALALLIAGAPVISFLGPVWVDVLILVFVFVALWFCTETKTEIHSRRGE